MIPSSRSEHQPEMHHSDQPGEGARTPSTSSTKEHEGKGFWVEDEDGNQGLEQKMKRHSESSKIMTARSRESVKQVRADRNERS